ncbi:MAG: hypothetical protein ACYC2O_05985 [Microthrixaceae bacterium]
MELRIHGVGGPSAESTLRRSEPSRSPQPGTYARAIWRSEPGARSAVRAVPGLDGTAVYHWSPLTSGSLFFALWPILLPFTLVNVSGWMLPDRQPYRSGLARRLDTARDHAARGLVTAICWSVTVSTVLWLAWLGQVVAGNLLPDGWSGLFPELLGLAATTVAVGAIVAIATYTSRGYERFPAPSPDDPLRRGPERRQLSSATFFRDAREHRLRWRWHVVLAVSTGLFVCLVTLVDDSIGASIRLADLASGTTLAQCALIAALALCCLPRSLERLRGGEAAPALLGAFGAATLGTMLVPALTTAAAITIGGPDAARGRAGIFLDVIGVAVAVLLAVGVAATAARLASPVHVATTAPPLLGSAVATMRARLATVPRRLDLALAACAVVLVVGTLVLGWRRWDGSRFHGPALDGASTIPGEPLAVAFARASIVFLVGFMFVSVWRRRADEESRRRVGNIWDVLTFWPRAHHPFAVRPYAERAVPELQEYLRHLARRDDPLDVVDVVAHSQGSVLVLAALLPMTTEGSPDADCLTNLRLVTFGSPIRTLHGRCFPAHIRRCDVAALDAALTRSGRGWRNTFRYTDHIGRAVFGPDSRPGHHDRPGLHDIALPDPPEPGGSIAGHSGYWGAADVEGIIASEAAQSAGEGAT